MKNKAPLSLMEQLIMLLIFALAATLCLQVYVLSGQISRRCEARDHAVTAVQSAAEAMKHCKGDVQQCAQLFGGTDHDGQWLISYDADWQKNPLEGASYKVLAVPVASDSPLLGCAEITAKTAEEETLFSVTVCWQEVPHE